MRLSKDIKFGLSYLGTHDDPHHALLNEGASAADVGAVGHQELRVLGASVGLLNQSEVSIAEVIWTNHRSVLSLPGPAPPPRARRCCSGADSGTCHSGSCTNQRSVLRLVDQSEGSIGKLLTNQSSVFTS